MRVELAPGLLLLFLGVRQERGRLQGLRGGGGGGDGERRQLLLLRAEILPWLGERTGTSRVHLGGETTHSLLPCHLTGAKKEKYLKLDLE